MTTTKQYDYLNRLTSISSSSSSSSSSSISFAYTYNSANQRIRTRMADNSYWLYLYDSLGQVISGHKFWPDESPVAGQQFDYGFDTIGNRTQALAGGDQSGGNQRLSAYTANTLNQYSQRTVPGAVDIMGLALATNPVSINNQTAYRKGEYFRQQVPVNNSTAPVWEGITVSASGQTAVNGNEFVPQTPETFTYDLDGNLTNDGRWTYSWDAENRLITMTANTSVGPQQSIAFAYDSQGRRIQKVVSTWNGSVYAPQSTNRFLYDGWNLVAELAAANTPLRTYVWGLDLSGSPQGAGGVGGLLVETYYGSQTTNCFAAFDGNGNVAALVNAADGTLAADYEYYPFGELLRATGPMARVNAVRFSTKYQDDETDLVYYPPGRYFIPTVGRWASRDRIGENGGANLYLFVANDPIGKFDILGQYPGVYTYSLSEMESMLRRSKEDFNRKLKSLCPIHCPYCWTDWDGHKQCCSPSACSVQADVLTLRFALDLELNFTTEYMRFGNVLAFTPLWIPTETINDRANEAPRQGMGWQDYDQGYGLKCQGMQRLMVHGFEEITAPVRSAGMQCFKGAEVGNNQNYKKASHHWFGVYGPFNNDVSDTDVLVDPWFSAGGIISPFRPYSEGATQYHNPILW